MLILVVLYLQLQTMTFQQGQCEGLNYFPTCTEGFRVKLKQQTRCTEKSQEGKGIFQVMTFWQQQNHQIPICT